MRERTVDFLTKASVPLVFQIMWMYYSDKNFFFFKPEGTFVVLVLLLRFLIKTALVPP